VAYTLYATATITPIAYKRCATRVTQSPQAYKNSGLLEAYRLCTPSLGNCIFFKITGSCSQCVCGQEKQYYKILRKFAENTPISCWPVFLARATDDAAGRPLVGLPSLRSRHRPVTRHPTTIRQPASRARAATGIQVGRLPALAPPTSRAHAGWPPDLQTSGPPSLHCSWPPALLLLLASLLTPPPASRPHAAAAPARAAGNGTSRRRGKECKGGVRR
jgi:hypothetical protein